MRMYPQESTRAAVCRNADGLVTPRLLSVPFPQQRDFFLFRETSDVA
jgi:hypothetical protein